MDNKFALKFTCQYFYVFFLNNMLMLMLIKALACDLSPIGKKCNTSTDFIHAVDQNFQIFFIYFLLGCIFKPQNNVCLLKGCITINLLHEVTQEIFFTEKDPHFTGNSLETIGKIYDCPCKNANVQQKYAISLKQNCQDKPSVHCFTSILEAGKK